MVLSAEALGIKDKTLIPFFCCECGCRIGWNREFDKDVFVYCEDCAKLEGDDEDD